MKRCPVCSVMDNGDFWTHCNRADCPDGRNMIEETTVTPSPVLELVPKDSVGEMLAGLANIALVHKNYYDLLLAEGFDREAALYLTSRLLKKDAPGETG